ncbi:group II intron reverse transcriptase/maturase [Macrococcoides canis]|uniref:group II intron reverse transcriptase/maturase n=1 Tax=Macrococcoides canis TaxID=1855823 RepID=UPI001AEC4FE8|nr:group II intron reverse transcriptase/maturase [Macrococcus canis]QTQ09284.1 group II intron reverse transcriptase/maturase [Macrococcus canis]
MYSISPSLMELVVNDENLNEAIKRVKANKGAAGVDGMTVDELYSHFSTYREQIKLKLLDGSYEPMPVKQVEIPKANGKIRILGIPVVKDRVIQQAIKQIIEPIIDKHFSKHSHGFRPRKSTHTAIKECIEYYEQGYKIVVDCDLKQCFDTFNHDKLMYLFERFIDDKAISAFIRKSLRSGSISLSSEYVERKIGSPQGGVISPLLCNIYLHELDKELEKRGHRFVRYADDFVIYVKSKRASERVIESITRFIEKNLKLIVNKEKGGVGSPTRLKFLSCLMFTQNGTCRFIPTMESKRSFRRKLKKTTSRKRPGTFEQIVKEINQATRGWINYFGGGFIKSFIKETEQWLNHRIRQLILKRWKFPRTIIKGLMKCGLDIDSAKRIAYSRKKYWRLSKTPEVHRAFTNKKLRKWGLVPLTELAEFVYEKY